MLLWGADTVSVISDSTHTVISTVPVGSRPIDLVYDSGKGTIFVGNTDSSGNGTVSVISDSDHSVIATVEVGGGPNKLAYDAVTGKIFVPSSERVSVISDNTNTLIDTIDKYAGISGAHDSVRGVSCYSGFYASKPMVWVVSDSTHEIIANLTLFERGNSYDIVFDSGKGVAYAVDGRGTVYAIFDSSLPKNNPDSTLGLPIEVIAITVIIAAVAIVAAAVFIIKGRKR